MYLPAHFAAPDQAALERLIGDFPLATLVVVRDGELTANHVPLQLQREGAELWLRGHLARANPLAGVEGEIDALAIFHGPEHYVSPGWYPGKAEDGRAVPTWNYCVAHAHGRLRTLGDPAGLRALLDALTEAHEAPEARPWKIDHAPPDYIQAMLRAVVGIEIRVERLTGKWKLSQNQSARNREGVIAALRARGDDAATRMAQRVADPCGNASAD